MTSDQFQLLLSLHNSVLLLAIAAHPTGMDGPVQMMHIPEVG